MACRHGGQVKIMESLCPADKIGPKSLCQTSVVEPKETLPPNPCSETMAVKLDHAPICLTWLYRVLYSDDVLCFSSRFPLECSVLNVQKFSSFPQQDKDSEKGYRGQLYRAETALWNISPSKCLI
eukprot:GFUD01108036.1.p1 GENE.GFUD01108036.1~~GFUD01108036.1.p1  ORF type:complete len:125 (+),score=20.41 GFUD01108036.1:68-442(+)